MKYLGVILDRKLNWRLNIELIAGKVCIEGLQEHLCKRMKSPAEEGSQDVHRRGSYQPEGMVWWKPLSKKYNRIKLNRIQRTTYAGATGTATMSGR